MKIVKAQVKLYEGKSGGYPLFTVSYYRHGKRVRENFRKLAKAKSRLHEISLGIERGRHAVMSLTHADWESYMAAKDALKPVGVPLHSAIEEYLALRVQQSKQPFIPKRVGEIVEELLDAKKRDGLSVRYIHSLRSHLRRFAAVFHVDVSSITAGMIEDWLEKLNVGGRTRNNIRNSIVTLFQFSRARGHLKKHERTEAEDVPRAKDRGGAVGILQPEQLSLLLSKADEEAMLWLTVAAFSGLRTAEMLRLEWSDFNFSRHHVVVSKHKSKTASRRIVCLSPNLRLWLQPFHGRSGQLFSSHHVPDRVIAFAKEHLKKWPQNCLRHSFITFRTALLQDVNRVALEAGTSPQMIFRNYRELVTEDDARLWFSIVPPKRSTKIVAFSA